MILAVTGGRDYTPNRADIAQLRAYWRVLHGTELRVGDCPTGVDEWIWRHRVLGVIPQRYVARWDLYGKAAGPRRNGWMLAGTPEGEGEIVKAGALLAFPGGTGTSGCVVQAKCMGIPVYPVDLGSHKWKLVRWSDSSNGYHKELRWGDAPRKLIIWDGTWQRRVLWDGSRFRAVRGWPGLTEPICWREDDPEWGKEAE